MDWPLPSLMSPVKPRHVSPTGQSVVLAQSVAVVTEQWPRASSMTPGKPQKSAGGPILKPICAHVGAHDVQSTQVSPPAQPLGSAFGSQVSPVSFTPLPHASVVEVVVLVDTTVVVVSISVVVVVGGTQLAVG